MAHPQAGDIVTVHYTGRVGDGTVFDSSSEGEPLKLTVGAGQVIPKFEQALTEMEPGDERTVTIPADEAYGPHRRELMIAVEREQLPPSIQPTVGQHLQVRREDGETAVVTIAEVTDAHVTLDANHPLAGEDLTFDLKLVDVQPG